MDREEILQRFEAWLDGVLASEEAPQGIAAELLAALSAESGPSKERPCDLYSVWAAVTSLTQEVKLQGRSFKQLSETLAPFALVAPQLPEMECEARERARGEMLNVMLDLRDRLARGLEAAGASQAKMRATQQSHWLARTLARHASLREAAEAVAALVEGYRLSLGRLDEVLAQSGVREIDCQGQPFDPATMHAVDIEETEAAAEGTVVAVYRAGYEWKGTVHRPAQVKVARRPASKPLVEDDDERSDCRD